MKRRYSMIKKYFVKLTLGFTLAGLLLGCSNLFTNAGEANSTYTKNNDEKVNCVITGSISTGAAMPSSLVPGLNNGNGEARSAFASLPNFTDDGISIEITATGTSFTGASLGSVNGTATASTSSYAISISDSGTWTITANMFKGTSENKKLIMQKTINGIKIDATNYRVNKNIELEVVEINDKGSIKLEIVDETGKVENVFFKDRENTVVKGMWQSCTISDSIITISDGTELFPNRSYSLNLDFRDSSGNCIFKVNNEAINVFANLTTDTWVKNGDEIYLQDNGDGTAKFVITDECLQSYTMKDFYVDAAKGNDSYKGSSYKPFKTLQAAAEAVGNSTNPGPFTIHLADGEYELNERNYISPKKSLTICGESRDGTKIIDKLESTVSFIANDLGVDKGVSKIEICHLTYVNDRSDNDIAKNLFDTSAETGQPIELRFGDVNFKTNGTISVTDEDHTRSIISIKNTDSLFIHDCLFSDISLKYTGSCNGAIINAPGGSSVAIQNTNFTNCKITSYCSDDPIKGGLIYSGGELTLKNVNFTKDAFGNKNEINANDNGIAGGLIYSDGSKFDFADCIFADTKMTAKEDEEITGAVYCKPEVPPSEYKYGNCKTYNIETFGTTNVKGVGLYCCPQNSGSLVVKFSGTTWFDDSSTIYLDEVPYAGVSGITNYGYISIASDLTPQNQYNQPVNYVATIAPKDNDYNYTIGKQVLGERFTSAGAEYNLVKNNLKYFKLLSAPGSDCDYKLVVDSNFAIVASALSTP